MRTASYAAGRPAPAPRVAARLRAGKRAIAALVGLLVASLGVPATAFAGWTRAPEGPTRILEDSAVAAGPHSSRPRREGDERPTIATLSLSEAEPEIEGEHAELPAVGPDSASARLSLAAARASERLRPVASDPLRHAARFVRGPPGR